MINLTKLRHSYPEKAGLCINRENGYPEYTFLHFHKKVTLLSGGELIETEPGCVIIYDVNEPQYYACSELLVHDWMHFSGDISSYLKLSGLSLGTVYYPSQSEFITAIIKEMETEFYGDAEGRNELLSLKLSELFIKLGRSVSGNMSPLFDKETRNKFRDLRGALLSEPEKKWSVPQMADMVGFSQSRFYSIYKSIYGISPTADLIGAKMDRAKNLLSFTNKKIEEIAESLGYDNVTHFIRQFKKETGITPSSFRKNSK
ncbi:MAG: helix-turn-helix transcriptional regulator [Clostridia bacterium]|nr:helix-turn-helix transcriptional regulator [Clostridia bacterium]